MRRERFGERQTEGREPCQKEGRNWSDAATSQGTLRIASNVTKLGRNKEGFFLRAFRRCASLPTL